MVYSVVAWEQFIDDLSKAPKDIAKKANSDIDHLKKHPDDKREIIKLKGFTYLFRKKVKESHRIIFYKKQEQVKILRLIIRDNNTYNKEALKHMEKQANKINDNKVAANNIFNSQQDNTNKIKSLFNNETLRNLEIPPEYWDILFELTIEQEDDVLNLDIPDEYLSVILEYLHPQEGNPVEYDLDLERTNALIEGEINLTSYRQSSLILDGFQEICSNLYLEKSTRRKAILIRGSAGTGKSLVAFHRIKKLVEAENTKVLYVTYSEALADYAIQVVTAMLNKPLKEAGVEILTVNKLIDRYYSQNYPKPILANEKNQLNCLRQALNTVEISDNLKNKLASLGNKYLLEEFLIVIESQEITSFTKYLHLERRGRKIGFKKNERKDIWNIYQRWKKIIKEELNYEIQEWINLETLNIIRKQYKSVDYSIDYYDSIIIDEAQDLSPVVLNLLILLAKVPRNLFLTADESQSLYQKGHCWKSLSNRSSFKYETKTLSNSYRSPQNIQRAYNKSILLTSHLTDEPITLTCCSQNNCSILDKKPTLLLTDKIENITNKIIKFFKESAKKYSNIPIHEGAIISNDYPDNFQDVVIRALQKKGLPVELFNSNSLDANNNCIKALNMYDAKGLEFPFVVVVGLSKGVLPKEESTNLDSEERAEIIDRQRRLFYVACTRATKSLLVIGSLTNRSEFLSLLNNNYWNKIKMQ